MKYVIFFIIWLFATVGYALDIPKKARVANVQPGYCCWASIETVGRVHNIRPLHGLVKQRMQDPDDVFWRGGRRYVYPRNRGYDYAVAQKLDQLGVDYEQQNTGDYSRDILRHAKRHGCVAGFKAGAFGKNPHAVVITSYGNHEVKFYDPNYPDLDWTASRRWFDHWWSGKVVVVFKPNKFKPNKFL